MFTRTHGIPYKLVRGFYDACKAAGLAGLTLYTVRHAFASRLLENGVDPTDGDEVGWLVVDMNAGSVGTD